MHEQLRRQIYVLIPTHNRRAILCATLINVRKQLPPESARLIVVDAGSTDGTRDAVQAQCPSVELIYGHSNMWWTASVNHGLRHIAKTARLDDLVLLMNDDIDLAPDALSRLLEASEMESQALIGAVNIVHRTGEIPRVYFCGGYYDLRFARHKSNIPEGTTWHVPDSRFLDSDFLYGRLLVIPWKVLQLVGHFDEENFPQYCADEDFCYRAKGLGIRVLVDTLSIVFVNEVTTARFSLSFTKGGLKGVLRALTAFNSCYNIKQCWVFSRRYAKWPIIYTLCRYMIILFRENIKTKKYEP